MRLSKTEIRLAGVPLAPGRASGRACFYCQTAHHLAVNAGNASLEEDRLHEALAWMSERLRALAREAEGKLDSEMADVFRAQRLILESRSLRQRLFEAIANEGLNAEGTVAEQLEWYQAQLRAVDSETLRERAADLAELQRGLLDRLRGETPSLRCKDGLSCQVGQCLLGNDHILLVPELTPGLTIEVDDKTRGFVTEKGGQTAHAAILAHALGLPAVSGIGSLYQTIPIDSHILLDGDTGGVILNPSRETLAHWSSGAGASIPPVVAPVSELKVLANIARAADVRDALTAAAEGIGLYRTEIEALAEGRLLSETEQETRYTEVIEAMAERPVYIRLIDLGADKTATWLGLPQEDNPALGCRGARLLLSRPELLREQARALARASRRRPIHVIYPMIVDADQFCRLRELFDAAISDLSPGTLFHGVLYEVPSACLQARELFEQADFGCVGTNDLVQYLFAVDRMNEGIEHEGLLGHSALWGVIGDLARVARKAGKPLTICGELAGNSQFTRRLMDVGVTAISVAPRRIAAVRRAAEGKSNESARPGRVVNGRTETQPP